MSWLWIWLAIIIITIIVEVLTVGLTSIWMTGGALGALVVAAISGPVWLQIIVFFVVTGVLLVFTRPWAIKHFNRERIRTNVDAIVGSKVRVVEAVNNDLNTGKVLCNGMEWTARSVSSDITFEIEEMAVVDSVQGVRLILKK